MFEYFAANFTLAVGVVCFFSRKSRQICFEEASRIGTKLLLIRIAGESGGGSITGAVVSLLTVKRQLAGIELIRPIMKEPCSGLRFSLVENKSKIFKNPKSAISLRYTDFLLMQRSLLFQLTSFAISCSKLGVLAFTSDQASKHCS